MSTDPIPADFIPPELEEIAKLLPNYEILSFIAKGGMGAVYLARQKSLDREVAIKILPRHFGQDEEFRSSFETEAKSMAKLNHPNLVGIYDFGQVDGMLYIIMEMVHGKSLYHATYGTTLEPTEAGRIVCEICHGLANAHKQGILHRDIKPANILLDPNASPKIGDFGLARPVGDHEADSAFGTPGYTAPEVVHNPAAVDESTDLYSVGAILYELLTGKLPEKLYMPAANLAKCDPRFDDIIRKAMNSNPVLRYRSAEAMAEAIEEIINETNKPAAANRLITAASPGAPRAQPPSRGASPAPVIKSGSKGPFVRNIFIIIILLGAIYFAWEHYKTRKAQREVENARIIEQNEQKKQEGKALLKKKRDAVLSSSNQSRATPGKPAPVPIPEADPVPIPAVTEVRCEQLEEIRQQCFSFVKDIDQKYEEKFSQNIKDLENKLLKRKNRDIDDLLLEMKRHHLDHNRIPDNLLDHDLSAGAKRDLDDHLRTQVNLEQKFNGEVEKLQGYYRKNLNKIVDDLKAKQLDDQIPAVRQEIDATDVQGQGFVDYILNQN